MRLYELTIHEAHELIKRGEISSSELTRAVLDRIAEVDDRIGAYITVAAETALAQAERADEAMARGSIDSPLVGIPIAVKDLICTQGVLTTCASRILSNFVPPFDATVIRKLKQAGAVIVGKTNMDEFAMGSSTENSSRGLTRNPWNTECVPGGSSGGSAAAVAADMCLGALGSDTGGSIRQPASLCGLVGLKPTYGRVSRYGLIAYASSLDQIGPMTKDVRDSALMLNAICGYDSSDSTSVRRAVPDYSAGLDGDLGGVRIGIPRGYDAIDGLDPAVSRELEAAMGKLRDLGVEFVAVDLPSTEQILAAYYVIASSEASSNLARYDGVKYGFRADEAEGLMAMYHNTRAQGFGLEVQRRIIVGTYCLSAGYYDAYYGKASQVRTLILAAFNSAFEVCDAVLTPVAPTPAFKIGEKVDDPLTMYLSDMFTLSANLAGIPGVSVPCGFSDGGLPIGMQLLASHFNEPMLFKIAYHFEQATDHHQRRPDLQ